MTTTELVEMLHHAYDGDPWHGPSLVAVLRDISVDAAVAHPLSGRHSIWEIVLHLTSWTREVDRRANGAVPETPREGDWPAVPQPPTLAAWTEALQTLEQAHRALEATVARTPDWHWQEIVGSDRDPAQGTGYSYGVMVTGLAADYAYHAGQIAVLAPRR